MKIRKLQIGEEIANNEYVIRSETSGLLAVTLDIGKIHKLTIGLIKVSLEDCGDEEEKLFCDFWVDNIEIFDDIIEKEIQYALDSMAMTFCTLKDDFKQIKRNFYNIGYRIENLIACLIWHNVGGIMVEEYQKERKM